MDELRALSGIPAIFRPMGEDLSHLFDGFEINYNGEEEEGEEEGYVAVENKAILASCGEITAGIERSRQAKFERRRATATKFAESASAD